MRWNGSGKLIFLTALKKLKLISITLAMFWPRLLSAMLSWFMENSMHDFNPIFKNRIEAGQVLGLKLRSKHITNPIVLALPRGGVIIGNEVAKILGTELDVVISRKIGSPEDEEFGIGAMAEDEVPFFNPELGDRYDFSGKKVTDIILSQKKELNRRITHYRGNRILPEVRGRNVILIDDGLATGVTAAAAAAFLRKFGPSALYLAVPVGPKHPGPMISNLFDEIIVLATPNEFQGVGMCYRDFAQVEDAEVKHILNDYHP
jgi:putative phosphoribosyl transferase